MQHSRMCMATFRMNDKWDNGNQNGKPKKSWDCAIRYNNPIGEIARDALLAESASGGLSRMYAMLMATHYGLPFFFVTKNA